LYHSKTKKLLVMKQISKNFLVLTASMLVIVFALHAQTPAATASPNLKMYVIERNIPGAGSFSQEKLKEISKTSCSVLITMGPSIQWVQSYVTGDKIFCVYKAENEELVREHAKKGGFPITNIYEVSSVISPATAQQ
jgi:Protein of unknown function (DUF4242)